MMALPFLLYTGGVVSIWWGKRRTAFFFWFAATALTLILFHFHSTDTLNIVL